MSMRKKIITAGPLVQEIIYPAPPRKNDSPACRREKKKASSEAQAKLNAKASWQKLKLLLAANLVKGDIVGCLTLDDEHLPETREQVRRRVDSFRQRLSKERAKRGQTLVMFWSIEHKHGEGRWHIHFACNATGDDYAEIVRLWGRGEVEMEPLRVDREKNYATLAQYMCKEAREKLGQRSWSYTRNAAKPEVERMVVDDDEVITIPADAIVFETAGETTAYGRWQFAEFAFPDALRARRRARRRRR